MANSSLARTLARTRGRFQQAASPRTMARVLAFDSRAAPGAQISPPPVHFPSDPNSIVTVNVQTILAPSPNTYQQTGCFVSYGATSLNSQEVQELTQRSDLDFILSPALDLQTLVWGAGPLVTGTVAAPLPVTTPGDVFVANIVGNVPAAFNETRALCTVIDAQTFTYTNAALSTDPGPLTTIGTVQLSDAAELGQMATTYFAQGNFVSVYVLELGPQFSMPARAALLETWLGLNPRSFYGYLMPRACGSTIANLQCFVSLLKQFQNHEAMTYFWFTIDPSAIDFFDENYKCVVQWVEAPAVTDPTLDNLADPEGEFSAAAMFYNAMIFIPSNSNRVRPMAFQFASGVTKYPTHNNGPLLKSFKRSNTNYVSNGAEGGIEFNIIYTGVTKDGQDYFNWWWTIDWVQIQINIDLSNAIINGANNPIAPLYYDQSGIDTLQGTLAATMQAASDFGMVVGQIIMAQLTGVQLQQAINNGTYAGACAVNAVPFIPYSRSNPSHYKIGEYDGLGTLFIPRRGFIHVLVNVAASQLVTI